jgi:peptidoglycan/LPS O-acetylase OafA/YrhL
LKTISKPNTAVVRDGWRPHYLPTLDGWRAIAISLVIFAHATESIGLATGIPFFYKQQLERFGLLGVQIFFGLSGFLITSLLIDEESYFGRISLKSFYVRRFFRIFPAAIVFLVTVGALSILHIIPVTIGRWFSTLFFFANYSPAVHTWFLGHFWSLAVEEHFYFLWPTAFLLMATIRRRATAAVVLAFVLALWRAVDFKYHITGSIPAVFWGRTDIQGDGLLWGVVVALLNADPVWRPRLHRWVSSMPVWVLLVLSIGCFGLFEMGNWKLHFILLTVKGIAIPLMLLGTVTQSERIPGRVLEMPLIRWFGKLAYSLYLWQQLFLCPNDQRIAQMKLLESFPRNHVLALACAVLSYYFVETPLIKFGHRVAKGIKRPQQAASPLPETAMR